MALAADSKNLYIPLATIYGKKNNDGLYALNALDIKNLNDNLAAIAKKIQGGITLADLTAAAVDTLTASTVVTNELYAEYGNVANVTVSHLRTDYKKATNYLNEDTSDIDYIDIQNEEMIFRTAQTDGEETEQLTVDGEPFFWVDGTFAQMTKEHTTEFPVIVYKYVELDKASFKFERVLQGTEYTVIPVLTLGVGNGVAEFSRAKIWKDIDGLRIEYRTSDGDFTPLRLTDEGFLDTTFRRVDSFTLNTTNSTVELGLEGEDFTYTISYSESSNGIEFSFPDGFQTTVTIT